MQATLNRLIIIDFLKAGKQNFPKCLNQKLNTRSWLYQTLVQLHTHAMIHMTHMTDTYPEEILHGQIHLSGNY